MGLCIPFNPVCGRLVAAGPRHLDCSLCDRIPNEGSCKSLPLFLIRAGDTSLCRPKTAGSPHSPRSTQRCTLSLGEPVSPRPVPTMRLPLPSKSIAGRFKFLIKSSLSALGKKNTDRGYYNSLLNNCCKLTRTLCDQPRHREDFSGFFLDSDGGDYDAALCREKAPYTAVLHFEISLRVPRDFKPSGDLNFKLDRSTLQLEVGP